MKKAKIIKKAEDAIAGIPYVTYLIREISHKRFRKFGRVSPSLETKYTKTVETGY